MFWIEWALIAALMTTAILAGVEAYMNRLHVPVPVKAKKDSLPKN
jgi:hypothetical protein